MREDEYVRMYLSNAEALYRSRAATALIKIGTPAAHRALAGGLKVDSLRPEVRERIEAALAE